MKKIFLWLTLAVTVPCFAQVTEQVVRLDSRGTSVSYLLSSQAGSQPDTIYLLFSGGTGEHNLSQRGDVVQVFNDQKFLARARKNFVSTGNAAALLDTPADNRYLKDAFRTSEEHVTDVKAVINDLHARYREARVVLVGHSNGSLSAAHVGRRLASEAIKVVLVNGRLVKHWYSGDGLSTFDFASLKDHILLVHHAKDGCEVTPYEGARALADRIPLVTLDGPDHVRASGCSGGTHNLAGRDDEAVNAILAWVKANGVANRHAKQAGQEQ